MKSKLIKLLTASVVMFSLVGTSMTGSVAFASEDTEIVSDGTEVSDDEDPDLEAYSELAELPETNPETETYSETDAQTEDVPAQEPEPEVSEEEPSVQEPETSDDAGSEQQDEQAEQSQIVTDDSSTDESDIKDVVQDAREDDSDSETAENVVKEDKEDTKSSEEQERDTEDEVSDEAVSVPTETVETISKEELLSARKQGVYVALRNAGMSHSGACSVMGVIDEISGFDTDGNGILGWTDSWKNRLDEYSDGNSSSLAMQIAYLLETIENPDEDGQFDTLKVAVMSDGSSVSTAVGYFIDCYVNTVSPELDIDISGCIDSANGYLSKYDSIKNTYNSETSIFDMAESIDGQAVVDYACQFVGNPYVWGGESLTNGCDCSGFIMQVYAHFGVSLPHSSASLRSVGYEVPASEIQPGDIVCYNGHCAIYAGNGKIVHASNSAPYPAGGIKISSNYNYRPVLAIRRIFDSNTVDVSPVSLSYASDTDIGDIETFKDTTVIEDMEDIEDIEDTENDESIEEDDIGGYEDDVDETEGKIGEEVMTYHVSPAYEGIFTEEDIKNHLENQPKTLADDDGTVDLGTFYDIESATAAVKEEALKRTPRMQFVYQFEESLGDWSTWQTTANSIGFQIVQDIFTHTGAGNEGDYLMYSQGGYGNGTTYTGSYRYATITIHFDWYTTGEEEVAVTEKLNEIYSSFDSGCTSDYNKMKDIYSWINSNVSYKSYDSSYLYQFTAYGALFDGTAVCQGYAALLYRMANDNGIDTHIQASQSMNHAWNIAQMGDHYYFLDSTWDSIWYPNKTETSWVYFLVGTDDFSDHTYGSAAETYNIPAEKYTPSDDEVSHTFRDDWEIVKEATCTEEGLKTRTCVCGAVTEEESIPATGHTEVIDEGIEATCTKDGLTEGSHCSVCNEIIIKQETISATGHAPETVQGKDATCTEPGLTEGSVCSICNEILTAQEEIQATGHTPVTVKGYDATCTEDGLTDGSKCSVCGEPMTEQEVIPALGHEYGESLRDDPTCEKEGKIYHTCIRCGNEEIIETLDKIDHDYVVAETVEPTCTEDGTRTFICSICGDEKTETYADALGHDMVKGETVEPTCQHSGYTEYACNRCDYTEQADITDPTDHDYQIKEVVEPTCTAKGYTVYECSMCGEIKEDDETDMIDHDYQFKETVEPTCTEGGYDIYACSVCGTEEELNETDALGHDMKATDNVEPTCQDEGYTTYECTRCGYTEDDDYTDVIPHDYVAVETVEPTCTEKGYTVYECSMCGTQKHDDETDMIPHDYRTKEVVEPTCTEKGYTVYECSVCGDIYQDDETEMIPHDYVGTETVEPTCTEGGYTVYKCSVCGAEKHEDKTDALGHDEMIKSGYDATCTEDGLTDGSYCGRCDEVLVEQEVIPATGHTEVVDEAVEPTCTEEGLTEGSHCSVCGEILIVQETVPMTEHALEITISGSEIIYVCKNCGYTKTEYIEEQDDGSGSDGINIKISETFKVKGEIIDMSDGLAIISSDSDENGIQITELIADEAGEYFITVVNENGEEMTYTIIVEDAEEELDADADDKDTYIKDDTDTKDDSGSTSEDTDSDSDDSEIESDEYDNGENAGEDETIVSTETTETDSTNDSSEGANNNGTYSVNNTYAGTDIIDTETTDDTSDITVKESTSSNTSDLVLIPWMVSAGIAACGGTGAVFRKRRNKR